MVTRGLCNKSSLLLFVMFQRMLHCVCIYPEDEPTPSCVCVFVCRCVCVVDQVVKLSLQYRNSSAEAGPAAV